MATRDSFAAQPGDVCIHFGLAFAFRMVEQIGSINNPFGNTKRDVPLTAITTIVERGLAALVGVSERPDAPQPVGGYLW